jgi:NADPH2:quinone reductase
VPPFDIMRLMSSGSVVLSRPSVRDFTASPDELHGRAGELFGAIASGEVRVEVTGRFGLEDAGTAHDELASRRSLGKLVLTV